jgi:hypothetical protein
MGICHIKCYFMHVEEEWHTRIVHCADRQRCRCFDVALLLHRWTMTHARSSSATRQLCRPSEMRRQPRAHYRPHLPAPRQQRLAAQRLPAQAVAVRAHQRLQVQMHHPGPSHPPSSTPTQSPLRSTLTQSRLCQAALVVVAAAAVLLLLLDLQRPRWLWTAALVVVLVVLVAAQAAHLCHPVVLWHHPLVLVVPPHLA